MDLRLRPAEPQHDPRSATLDVEVDVAAGEELHVEISAKFRGSLADELDELGFETEHAWTDGRRLRPPLGGAARLITSRRVVEDQAERAALPIAPCSRRGESTALEPRADRTGRSRVVNTTASPWPIATVVARDCARGRCSTTRTHRRCSRSGPVKPDDHLQREHELAVQIHRAARSSRPGRNAASTGSGGSARGRRWHWASHTGELVGPWRAARRASLPTRGRSATGGARTARN